MEHSILRNRRMMLVPFIIGTGIAFLFVWLFAAALHDPQPHDLRVGVVGPPMLLTQLETKLAEKAPGAFLLSSYESPEAARAAIEDREITGALVLGTGTPLLMVASGAGQPAAAAISGAFSAIAQALGKTVTVEDVRPLPKSDSRGLVPFFVVMGVSISAFFFSLLFRNMNGPFRRYETLTVLPTFAVLAGLFAGLSVGVVVGFNNYWLLAGICALLALAVASGTGAFVGLFGKAAGTALAGIILILLGNASSGSVIGSSFLPQPFRALSPVLPAGAGLEALRSGLYFDGAGLTWSAAALGLWVIGSLLVLACVIGLGKRTSPADKAPN